MVYTRIYYMSSCVDEASLLIAHTVVGVGGWVMYFHKELVGEVIMALHKSYAEI